MNAEALYLPVGPYLHVAEATVSEITSFGWSITSRDSCRVVVRFLRGRKMKKFDGLDNEFAAAMQFPWYYGENWAAFDECLKDLSWMPGDAYVLVITDSKVVLEEESEEQFSILTNILQEAGQEWSHPLETSEPWSHPAVAFHVIFQCDREEKEAVVDRLSSSGASFDKI